VTAHEGAFYQRVFEALAQPPDQRYLLLAQLHADVYSGYVAAIRALSVADAARVNGDGRSVAQVVGHIMEWERVAIMAAGELLAGVDRPRFFTARPGWGYLDPNGTPVALQSLDDFNHYHAERHATWPWAHLQELSIRSADVLYTLFTDPKLLSAEILERTPIRERTLENGAKVTIGAGWYLWIIMLGHEAVDHADDLGWGYAAP
jgi:hypothetical protein